MRILVTSTPGMGHLNSLLPLMSALQSGRHDVLLVTAADSCERIERQGFAVRPGGISSTERRRAFEPRMPEVRALPPRRRRGLLFSGFFAEAAAPPMRIDLIPIFEEFEPEVVIHERGELASSPMAIARGIPHVTVAFSGSLPPWSDELVIEALAPLWADEGLAKPTIDQINGDVYLHPFPPSFGQAPVSGDVRPMRAVAIGDDTAAPPEWLDALGKARPLVYLTAGTEPAGADAPWAAIVDALGSFDVDVVATIGPHLDPSTLGAIPTNIRVERFVQQRLVLERATVAMSHAGAGSMLGAATRGVPQVLFPMVADQWENADAAAGAGAAIVLELDHRSSADVSAALLLVLQDGQIAQWSTRVAAEIEAMPTPADHVATIEEFSD